MDDVAPEGPPQEPAPRKPRKIFLLVGVVLAVALGVGLFTSEGTSKGSSSAPQVGRAVPAFTAANLNGSGQVHEPTTQGGRGTPSVLLFFGNWCPSCHAELPPLAATVRQQDQAGGALSTIHFIGVDSEDAQGTAKSFIKSSGVTFPVAYDPNTDILAGDFYFKGDPNAVFVNANGTINRIVYGDQLTPSSLTADEKALIPSGK